MKPLIEFTAQWLLVVPALLVVAAILVRRHWKRDILEAAAAGIATIVLVKIAASAFVERRPFVVEHVRPLVAHPPDNSFPSDHLAACGLAFAYLFVRSRPMALLALLCAAIIAWARVAARLHWPLDVTAGFVIGALAAGLTWVCAQRLSLRLRARASDT